jgi:hypothetical protein
MSLAGHYLDNILTICRDMIRCHRLVLSGIGLSDRGYYKTMTLRIVL